MKRYLGIYKSLLKINFVAITTYRANFINSLISALIWAIFVYVQMVLIFGRTRAVFGWNQKELILLTVVYGLVVGIFHFLFARSFERFSRLMAWSNFDAVLLKPVDSQFSLSFWEINYAAISRVVMGIVLLIYLLLGLSFQFQLINVLLFTTLILTGVLILYSIWVIGATFIIFVPELTNILDLLYTINGFSRFPPQMYKAFSPILFFLALPVVYIASAPLKVIIGKADFTDIISLVVIAAIFLIFSRAFWIFGMKHYVSSSS